MPGFRAGDKVRVKGQPFSPFSGKIGTVKRSHSYGLAITYEVIFDGNVSAGNQFFEYDLERIPNYVSAST